MPKGLARTETGDGRLTRRERPRESLLLSLGRRDGEPCRLSEELELRVRQG